MASRNPNIDPRTGKWNRRDPFSGRFVTAKSNIVSVAKELDRVGGDLEEAVENSFSALANDFVYNMDSIGSIPIYSGNLSDSIGVIVMRNMTGRSSQIVRLAQKRPAIATAPQSWGKTVNHEAGEGWGQDFFQNAANTIAQTEAYAQTFYMHVGSKTRYANRYRSGEFIKSFSYDYRIALIAAIPYAQDLDTGESLAVRGKHINWFNGLSRSFMSRVKQSLSVAIKTKVGGTLFLDGGESTEMDINII